MTLYLDLFVGDPVDGGYSVLSAITGSATRSDVTSVLQLLPANAKTNTALLTNTDLITVSTASANQTNVSYAALYDAPTGGDLVIRGRIGAGPTIWKTYPAVFKALQLTFLTQVTVELFWGAEQLEWGGADLLWGEANGNL